MVDKFFDERVEQLLLLRIESNLVGSSQLVWSQQDVIRSMPNVRKASENLQDYVETTTYLSFAAKPIMQRNVPPNDSQSAQDGSPLNQRRSCHEACCRSCRID